MSDKKSLPMPPYLAEKKESILTPYKQDELPEAHKKFIDKVNARKTSQLYSSGYDNLSFGNTWTIPGGATLSDGASVEIAAPFTRPYAGTTCINLYNYYNNVNMSIQLDGYNGRVYLNSWDNSHGWHSPSTYCLNDLILSTGDVTIMIKSDSSDSRTFEVLFGQSDWHGWKVIGSYETPDGSWTSVSKVEYITTPWGSDHSMFKDTLQVQYNSS